MLSVGDDDATTAEGLSAAAAIFREVGMPFWLAVTLLEHAEWLAEHEPTADAAPLLAEAHDIFERLEARPFLSRVAALSSRETISA